MSERTRRRIDAAMGAVFVVLLTLTLALPGQPPKAEDSMETVTAIVVDHRTAFLVSGYLGGLAAMAYLWFLGSVRTHLAPSAREEGGGAASAGGVFGITLLLLGMLMFSGVAFVVARLGQPALVRAFTDTGNGAIETSKFGFGLFVLAVSRSGAASGLLPRWLTRLGIAIVPLILVSAVCLFVDRGPFQFGGVVDVAGSVPALLWIAALSVVIMRSESPEAARSA